MAFAMKHHRKASRFALKQHFLNLDEIMVDTAHTKRLFGHRVRVLKQKIRKEEENIIDYEQRVDFISNEEIPTLEEMIEDVMKVVEKSTETKLSVTQRNRNKRIMLRVKAMRMQIVEKEKMVMRHEKIIEQMKI